MIKPEAGLQPSWVRTAEETRAEPDSANAEPFGQETQLAKRPVRVDEVEVVVENSNATRQKVEGRALDAG